MNRRGVAGVVPIIMIGVFVIAGVFFGWKHRGQADSSPTVAASK